jgi:hypothetical protein
MRQPASATARIVAAVVGALVLAGCGSTQPAPSPAQKPAAPTTTAPAASTTTAAASPYARSPAVAIPADEATLSALYNGCAGTCAYETASTPDGAGGTLYAIEVEQQFADGYGRGAVFFFHGETVLPGTGALEPGTSVENAQGLDWVLDPGAGPGISVPSSGHFAVTFVVSSAANMCNACDGNDGTTTFTYGWNGTAMVVDSGTPPTPPAVVGDGTTQ